MQKKLLRPAKPTTLNQDELTKLEKNKKNEQLYFDFFKKKLSQHKMSMQQTDVATEKVIVGGL